MIKQNISMLM